jgi:hypothetical protein
MDPTDTEPIPVPEVGPEPVAGITVPPPAPTPAAAESAPPQAAAAPGAPPAAGAPTDLSPELYAKIERRLRMSLLADRERKGSLADWSFR